MADDVPPKPPRLPPPTPKRRTGELPKVGGKRKSGENPKVGDSKRAKADGPVPPLLPPTLPSIPTPPPPPVSIPRPKPKRAQPAAPAATAEQTAAELRGNVVAPVAGEMLVGVSDDDRTTLHKIPREMSRGEFDEESHTLTRRASGSNPTILEAYADEARVAVAAYGVALQTEEEADRRGRLHFEIARLSECVLGDLDQASKHYADALEATPDRLPVITGARRVMLARAEYAKALELFDRELRVTADRSTKASLMFCKARVLENHLGRAKEAREVYTSAGDLVVSDAVLLKAIEQTDWTLKDWTHLADAYAQQANAVGADAKHRAALVVRRARQIEVHSEDLDAAAQLYEEALDIDHRAPGAVESLKRLHYDRRRWRELIRVLETEGELAKDLALRIASRYRVGQIHADRLGNRKEAIASLEAAAQEAPDEPFVLDALARQYERAGSHPALANTLSRLAESTLDPRERLGYLHRIGELCRDELHDDEAAIGAYEAALEIDPTYVPALRSLAPMYSGKEKWDLLVQMHEREAQAIHEPGRRAVAHARAAEILERASRRVEAIAHHERALTLDPGLASSFRALLRLYSATDEHHKLVELYERALDNVDRARRIEYLFAIGDLYRGPLDDAEQAEAAYRRILEVDSKHLGAVHALQRTAEQSARWRKLVDALELETRMVSDKTEIVALLYRAGMVLKDHLDVRNEAVARFKRVLELDPRHKQTLASLGRIHHVEGHWVDLVEVYRRELDICDAPSKVALLHKMGEVYSRFLADPTKAADCFRQALELDPRHAPSSHALSQIFIDRGEWAELVALVEREQRDARDPKSEAVAAFRAGEIYEEHLDDAASAEVAFARATELRPDDDAASEALARVRTQLQRWQALAEDLEARASRTGDPDRGVALRLRAGEVWFDRVSNVDRATGCYEAILAAFPDHVGALLGLEPLYRQSKRWVDLADIYARQVRVFADPGAKAGALTERARVLELHDAGSLDDLAACYTAILSFRPADRGVLEGLERLALRSDDPRALAEVDAQLADAASDSELKSAHLTRRAEAMETSGQPQALDVFRRALRLDPDNLGAVRGLARVAELIGHGPALVESAEAQARLARDPEEAANHWARAGGVQLDQLDDRAAGVRAFEEALVLWPDHVGAATQLIEVLSRDGEYEVLAERLGRAAAEAKQPERQHALWVEVSRLHARELANLGAALSALRKLVDVQPTNGAAHYELGALLHSDRRFEEAVDQLTASLENDPGIEVARQAHTMLASSHESLGDNSRAHRHYEMALELAPEDHELLQRVVNLQMADGAYEKAVPTATRLVQVARNDAERCRGLVLLARAKNKNDELDDALGHLADAVLLEGPRGRAYAELRRMATEPDHWKRYVDALGAAIRRRVPSKELAPSLYLEMATVQRERVKDDAAAMQTLSDGLRSCESKPTLRFALAKLLREASRNDDAIEQYQYLLMEEVDHAEAWRGLSETYGVLGWDRHQGMALASVAVLDAAKPGERALLRTWNPKTSALGTAVLRDDILAELVVAREQQLAASALIAAVADGLSRVRPPDLSRHGVSARDKISTRSEHPFRSLVDRLALSFGVEEFDLYVHHVVDRPAIIENTPRPSLILPNWLGELPRSGQVFMVSHALHLLARGLYPIGLMSHRELEIVLAASARSVSPRYTSQHASPDTLDDRLRLILRGLPRRRRRGFEAAAEAYARSRPLDLNTATQWMQQTARRVALVVADDLVPSLATLARMEGLGATSGEEFARHPVVGDLMRVWISKPAMVVRQRLGMLPPPSRPGPPPPGH